jgi:hypothetical protein
MWKLALVLLVAASACSAQSLFDSCLKSYAKITDPAAKCNAFGIYVRCFNLVAQGNTPSSSLPLSFPQSSAPSKSLHSQPMTSPTSRPHSWLTLNATCLAVCFC